MLHCKWHRRAERNRLKIMKRWRLLELNTAFQTYKSHVKSILKQKALFKRAASRIKYMQAHACLNKWISYVNERCRVRRIVRSYLNKQSKESSTKRLSRGWNVWCRYINKIKLSEMSIEQQAKEMERQKRLMARLFFPYCTL